MQEQGELQAWENAERISQEIIIVVAIKKVITTIMYACIHFNQAFLKQL